MQYRDFGRSGAKVSALGFGCMRFPMVESGGKQMVDDEKAGAMLMRAYEKGVNYFDSAWGYCERDSQRAVGKALHAVRDKVYFSTKLPIWLVEKPDDFWFYLESALKEMDTEYIDFYHFHAVNAGYWGKMKEMKLLDLAEQAKARGMIRNISFSFHDLPALMDEIVDTGVFDSLLCQYNLIDRQYEQSMARARAKGVGVTVMGPLGGGNIIRGGDGFVQRMGSGASSAAEMGLRFVWGNPAVSIALSGMTSLEEVDQNAAYTEGANSVSPAEWESMKQSGEELYKLNQFYCTGCDYCDICPQGIKPSQSFRAYINHNVWGLSDSAKKAFSEVGTKSSDPDLCTSCGLCAEKCPQKIDIPSQLKTVVPALRAL